MDAWMNERMTDSDAEWCDDNGDDWDTREFNNGLVIHVNTTSKIKCNTKRTTSKNKWMTYCTSSRKKT